MASLQAADKRSLTSLFGTRVSFGRMERKLYGHDTAEMPSLVKPLVGSTVPAAVVQPASEEELVALVRWAQEKSMALTPRGKATSGYGGVLPVKGGLVVDFFHLSKLLEIDTKNLIARVQPGICWEKLDRELTKKDLTLRLYPSSYPASTVGGWLAQGGRGSARMSRDGSGTTWSVPEGSWPTARYGNFWDRISIWCPRLKVPPGSSVRLRSWSCPRKN